MGTYRQKLEDEMVADLRRWLDVIEEQYGPAFALEAYSFVGAVGFTPESEEPDAGEMFTRSAVGYHCSDPRSWAQIGLLRQALLMAEADDDD